jgi:2'-5' RNA ligase
LQGGKPIDHAWVVFQIPKDVMEQAMGVRSPPLHRLFFTLYPDPATAERISLLAERMRRRHGLKGRPTASERLHISLNSLGLHSALPEQVIAKAVEVAANVRMRPFVVSLDRALSWKSATGKRPLVLVGDEGVAGVFVLYDAIQSTLADAGLMRRRERGIRPHITLLRDRLGAPEEFVDPVMWTVEDFALTHSPYGESRHNVLGRWPLAR